MNGAYFKEKIVGLFKEIRKEHEVDSRMLCENGAICYMNGNDSTEFDWQANERLCEFMIFWKISEVGFIKVFVNKNGKAEWYVYNDGAWSPKASGSVQLVSEDEALTFAALMVVIADNKFLWDKNIDDLGWDVDTSSPLVHDYVCALGYDPDEEEEWWNEEYEDEESV